jgi:putative FmdB family regulatory protein
MTYEYECTSCGHKWEEEQSIRSEATKICPSCKKETAKRLISSGNFILQGSGWYKTGGY